MQTLDARTVPGRTVHWANAALAAFAMLTLALCGCSKRGGTPGAATSASVAMTRVPGGDYSPFTVTLTATKDGVAAPALAVTLTASGAGATVSGVTDHGDGTYSATVTPAYSGEVVVTGAIAAWGFTKTATAVVMKHVATGWGQPMAVAGSVNTTGWEDSLNISADGQWLTLLYSPVSISGVLHNDPNHPWAKYVSGPYSGPTRPNFPRNRIAADGSVTYSYPLYFIANTGTAYPPPTAMYGFHRQPDGSFGEPFLLAPDDSGNGCMGEFGACLVPGTDPLHPDLVYAFNDPSTVRDGDISDIVSYPITLGVNNILGHYSVDPSTHVISHSGSQMVTVGIDTAGHQGNPGVYTDLSGQVQSLWFDDETASEEDVYVHSMSGGGTWPAGPWGPTIKPPPPVNLPGVSEIQPFFNGSDLLLRRENTIVSIAWVGGAFDQAASWGATTVLLDSDPTVQEGRIITIGEPSLATVGGVTELYFIYAVVGPYDAAAGSWKLDLNAAVVRKP